MAVNTLNSVTLSVTMAVSYDTAYAYLTDPNNLPEWSFNFIKKIDNDGTQWIAHTEAGIVPLTITTDADTGIFDMSFGDGPAVPTRLMRNGDGCDYAFTLRQPPDVPDPIWNDFGVPGLQAELVRLKEILEAAA